MDAVNMTIRAMQSYFTVKELQHISDALDQYNRVVSSKQQRHTVDRLHQIFMLSVQRKAV